MTEPDLVRGEESGFDIWGQRQTLSTLHELLRLIETSRTAIASPSFQETIQRMGSQSRRDWQRLLEVVDGGSSDPLAKFLLQVRNNVGYHYYQPASLRRGYDEHFFEADRDPFNEFAFVAVGKTLKASRFYFADAAAQAYLHRQLDADGTLIKQAAQIIEDLAGLLREIVLAYMAVRSDQRRRVGADARGSR